MSFDERRGRVAAVHPAPSAEEAAAIVAAIEASWPQPVAAAPDDDGPRRGTAWRFSSRWWSRPVPSRRDRPFR
jgi:hypothetical protein